jgi:short-subunit dehydrogenase
MAGAVVVIGAGPGLGVALARRFGGEGHPVALVARNAHRVGAAAKALRDAGVSAGAFPADVTDADALRAALDAAAAELGPVDTLIWSVGPGSTGITPAAEVTPEGVSAQVGLQVGGAVTAVRHVLPGMTARGAGTILLATGASSVVPLAFLGDVGIAMAGLRNWALALRTAVAGGGVNVATVTIATLIANGDPIGDPDVVAGHFLALHRTPEQAEAVVGDLEAIRRLAVPA